MYNKHAETKLIYAQKDVQLSLRVIARFMLLTAQRKFEKHSRILLYQSYRRQACYLLRNTLCTLGILLG